MKGSVALLVLLLPAFVLASEIRITADRMTYDRKGGVVRLQGKIRAWYGNVYLEADRVTYWVERRWLIAEGDVFIAEGGDELRAQRAELDLETKTGALYGAKIFLKRRHFHITGEKIEKLADRRYRIHQATLTSCDDCPPSWQFTCKRLDVEVEGYARGWWPGFRIKGLPVLYFPWAIFPVKRERQTGFLVPSFSHSDRYGPIFTVPFFWAIAKNQDATFYLTQHGDSRGRGFKLGVEYRFARSTLSQGDFRAFWIYDRLRQRHRGSFFSNQSHRLPYDVGLMADVNLVSDRDYHQDFEDDLKMEEEAWIDVRSKNQLESLLYIDRDWGWGRASAEFSYFQDLRPEADQEETLQRLPRFSLQVHRRPLAKGPLWWELDAQAVHFWRPKGVRGGRFDLKPRLSLPLRPLPFLNFEPWLEGRGTLYLTHDPEGTYEDATTRGLVEGGWSLSTVLSRTFLTRWGRLLHLVEPELRYHWRPSVHQEENPYYDSSDRLSGQSLFTLEITQYLKALAGEGQREVGFFRLSQGLDTFPGLRWQERLKELKAELRFSPLKGISLRGDASYNHHKRRFDAFNAAASLAYRMLNLWGEYRFSHHEVEEVNAGANLALHRKVDLWVAYRYNLLFDYRVETEYGLRYKHQCWELALTLRDRGRSPDGTQKAEWRAMVEVTLKGIGTFKVR